MPRLRLLIHSVVSILPGIMCAQIYGLVLAAGMARRMGKTKQLLPFGDRTVLQTVVDTLCQANLAGTLVVLGHDAQAVRNSLCDYKVDFCINDAYRQGMFSSLLCGLQNLPTSAEAVLVALGDQPQIERCVVNAVVNAYCKNKHGIVIPTWADKRGHPIVIDLRRYRDTIFALSGDEGLKPVVRGNPEDTLEVPIDDDGILRDLDTPEDYRAEIKRQEGKKTDRK